MRKQINEMSEKKISIVHWILSILLPPYGAVLYYCLSKNIDNKCKELGIETKDRSVLCAIFGAVLLTFVPLAVLQSKLNKIYKVQ